MLALVDIFSTTQHSEYYNTYKLYVATVLAEPVIYGAVIPKTNAALRSCFLSYQGNHQLEIHEILEKFSKTKQVLLFNSVGVLFLKRQSAEVCVR